MLFTAEYPLKHFFLSFSVFIPRNEVYRVPLFGFFFAYRIKLKIVKTCRIIVTAIQRDFTEVAAVYLIKFNVVI